MGGRRAIITGGEPLLELPVVLNVLRILSAFPNLEVKALYTNGSKLLDAERNLTIAARLAEAGLGSVNLSVHHHHDGINNRILDITSKPTTKAIASELRDINLPFRFNLVLQKGGIATVDDLLAYVINAAHLGASDVYVREMAQYTYDQPMCATDRDVLNYTTINKVSAKELADALTNRSDVRKVGYKEESFREKWEMQFVHLATNCPFAIAANVIGSERRDGMPYLVLMPDAKLYRGWLGKGDVLAEL